MALTLASGSIMKPSVSWTPISSGRSSFQMPCWSSRFGTGRIAEAVALAAIPRSEALLHGHVGGIGETPVFANAAMQPFGAGFGGFDRQGLQRVRQEEFAALLGFLRCVRARLRRQ